jgi:hypothetical protein
MNFTATVREVHKWAVDQHGNYVSDLGCFDTSIPDEFACLECDIPAEVTESNGKVNTRFTPEQKTAILVALRYYQGQSQKHPEMAERFHLLTETEPLSPRAIDELCATVSFQP